MEKIMEDEIKETEDEANEVEDPKTEETRVDALMKEMLEIRENLKEKYDIKCMTFAALLDDSDTPIVVFDGDKLNYTQLATQVAKRFRNDILKLIDI